MLFYCNCVGPSKDASTGEVIWRHRALDADGICSPGGLTYGNVQHCVVGLFSFILRNCHQVKGIIMSKCKSAVLHWCRRGIHKTLVVTTKSMKQSSKISHPFVFVKPAVTRKI